MKGVILAGGLGTRLYPLTHVTNKHLLPVYDKPMIYYPIRTLVQAGITEIMIVTGGPHCGHFMKVLKNGDEWGIKHLEYAYQEKEGGIADALKLAKSFADEGPIAVILGDNTTDANIKKSVQDFKSGAVVFVKEVSDPHRFGVAVFDPKDKTKILRIDEKPKNPETNFAVTGLYIYDNNVFDYIKQCDPGYIGRGELEITQVNNFYVQEKKLTWQKLEGFWSDAGTFESLFRSNEFWAKRALEKTA